MGVEIIATILGGLASLALGGAASSELIRDLIRKLLRRPQPSEDKPYAERLKDLVESLTRASQEVDSVLLELAQVARDRQGTVAQLESELGALEIKERHLKERIEMLEKVPIPVAEHFATLLEAGQRRSARRDYLLFGAGVVVTTVVAVTIQFLVP